MWSATILMTLPLSFRTIFDLMQLDSDYDTEDKKEPWRIALFNLYFFILTTYLPIIF
jgi:hypothetical protein